MSFGEPTDPYAKPPEGGQGYGYPQAGYPQAQAGYGYPQQGYGYPPPGTLQAHNGFINMPGLGTVRIPSMGRRFAARVLDAVLYVIVYVIAFVVAGASLFGAAESAADACDQTSPTYNQCLQDHLSSNSGFFGGILAVYAVLWIFSLLYEWLMVSFFGGTVGKLMLGMRVVKESTGGRPGLGGGFIRWIVQAAGALVCGIGEIVVWLSPLFGSDGKNRGWHDRASGTIVVRPAR